MTDAEAVLKAIESCFAAWVADRAWACHKGCAACCSQNVTITAVEGERILRFLEDSGRTEEIRKILHDDAAPQRPRYTINTLARACLAGKELSDNTPEATLPCPFLEQNSCTIYPARPFACRCFHSLVRCGPGQPALVDDSHLAAATAINQLLEHLCQRQPWGNMLDVLPQLAKLDQPADHTLRAQPLPGLLLAEKEYQSVGPLLDQIFAMPVNGKRLDQVLNGY